MSLPSPDMVREVYSQLCSIMDTPIGTVAMTEIDRELTPILVELLILGPQKESDRFDWQHPTARVLFDWLVHPQRTVEEFNYVVGPLSAHVEKVMEEHFQEYLNVYALTYPIYLSHAAAEVLAVKCPKLEGAWEHAAWLVVRLAKNYSYYEEGTIPPPSNHLITWIINTMGDPDMCPNSFLRIELMCMLRLLDIVQLNVGPDNLNMHNRTQLNKSVMFACSALDINYLSECYYGDFTISSFGLFYDVFTRTYDCCTIPLEMGEELTKELKNINSFRLSSTLHDFSYKYGLNPNNHTAPRELQSLIALLNTTAMYIQRAHKEINNGTYHEMGDIFNIECSMDMFEMLMLSFSSCYQMPQLTYPTAMLVMVVVDFVLTTDDGAHYARNTEKILKKLLTNDRSITADNSPIGREVICRYGRHLRRIRECLDNLQITIDETYPTICSLLKHD